MGLLDLLSPNWQTPQQNAQDQYRANDRVAQGAGGILGQIIGFPRQYMETYQPGQSVRDHPEATDWAANMALNMVGTPGGVGGLGSGARGYAGVPESLMGFRKNGPQRGFTETNYPHEQNVRVHLPNGDVFDDAIKGMNGKHAVARALLNWPGARVEPIK